MVAPAGTPMAIDQPPQRHLPDAALKAANVTMRVWSSIRRAKQTFPGALLTGDQGDAGGVQHFKMRCWMWRGTVKVLGPGSQYASGCDMQLG